MLGRNRDAGVGDRQVDTEGGRAGLGARADIHAFPSVKLIANVELYIAPRAQLGVCDDPEGWGGREEGSKVRGYVYTHG